ncbi:probable disease resistance protein At1g61300 [Eucalyptus grandis]|uniref:probable disease resistance protein At1g61300 n=1 Tax=Eucalyptus grandis TaxID=71139 RepID=UPI00192EB9B9|nr:probable disease resistance protein At1g61300 [Eucalyptus grandis]
MELAGPLLETVKGLWGLASKPVGYIYNLKDNVRLLDEKNKTLKSMSGDVKTKVECEEVEAHVGPTKQVEDWLGRVQKFFGEVDQILREARERDEIKCLSRWLPRNCWSSYKLGKRVDQLLNEMRQLQNEREKFIDLTSPLPPPPVLKKPMDKPVGLDFSPNKVLKWLVDEKQVGVIGLYGTGGVGKTTFMKRINEELSHANHKFDVVIWVVVSRQVNEDSIQDAIRKRLNITDESWGRWTQDDRINHLLKRLTNKKFVLLIDDVWERLDLSKIGVPPPSFENGSKVVFTTRSEQVCYQMQADKILEVQCLNFKEALALFENNVGKSTIDSHPDILELAKDIVQECKGLPLALITVGRAMAGRKKPSEWKGALGTLKNIPYKLSGMVEDVYHILEFSYISLNDSTDQLCFLYCCLFPEDYHIGSRDLIELWIGEGLLGDTNDVYNMREKGEYILGSLKMACLLESGRDDDEEEYVKMHDVIRDMAIWIACDHGKNENKLLVIENEEDMSTKGMSKWGEAEKVSLWGKWISNIHQAPLGCSQLRTLIVRETKVSVLPGGFFESMAACLTVLDLSDNDNIKSFPEGICNLISLQYLNLSRTCIRELPKEISNLTCLQWLLLYYMKKRILIPIGAIASLPLNVFSMWGSSLENEEEVVEELGRMQGLTDLSIKVNKSSSALKIFQSFQRCIRRVGIENCEGLTHIPISHSLKESDNFSHLEVLHLYDCHMLVKMEINQGIGQAPKSYCFPSLVEVSVSNCGFLDLSWLVHTPKLQSLIVWRCHSMDKIIGDGIAREELAASGLFSRLKFLGVSALPKLRSICDHALLFPQGVEFLIMDCLGLRKLPLDSNGMRGSFSIEAEKGWWEEFEWDPAARVTFQWPGVGPVEEMTYGEAARKIKDDKYFNFAKLEFLA